VHPNAELIDRFYRCFAQRNVVGMARSYHPEVVFSDPAFGELVGPDVLAMWQMLCARGKDLTLEHRDVVADDHAGSAHWEARYSFSQTGRPVHNVIEARFAFRDGLIVRHDDTFDFWRWSRQALGPIGLLLGWSPMLRNKVRGGARTNLAAWRAKNPPPV
jgi:ketosteroid isomerase-like protein